MTDSEERAWDKVSDLEDENARLKAQIEELKKKHNDEICNLTNKLLDSWCRNEEDYCPHLKQLEAQIEKMKNCLNCAEPPKQSPCICDNCGFDRPHWKLKE